MQNNTKKKIPQTQAAANSAPQLKEEEVIQAGHHSDVGERSFKPQLEEEYQQIIDHTGLLADNLDLIDNIAHNVINFCSSVQNLQLSACSEMINHNFSFCDNIFMQNYQALVKLLDCNVLNDYLDLCNESANNFIEQNEENCQYYLKINNELSSSITEKVTELVEEQLIACAKLQESH